MGFAKSEHIDLLRNCHAHAEVLQKKSSLVKEAV